MTEQTPSDPKLSNNKMVEDEIEKKSSQNQLPFPEPEVDLNEIFPDEKSDLNELFPDEEIKLLLKKVQRNKKDLHTMTDRFADDDWAGNTLTDQEKSLTKEKPSSEDGNQPQDSTNNL
jgi:hypothetical protein